MQYWRNIYPQYNDIIKIGFIPEFNSITCPGLLTSNAYEKNTFLIDKLKEYMYITTSNELASPFIGFYKNSLK